MFIRFAEKFSKLVTDTLEPFVGEDKKFLSYRELAKASEISNGYISTIQDKYRCPENPDRDKLAAICKQLPGIQKDYLYKKSIELKLEDPKLQEMIGILQSLDDAGKDSLLAIGRQLRKGKK